MMQSWFKKGYQTWRIQPLRLSHLYSNRTGFAGEIASRKIDFEQFLLKAYKRK